MGVGVGQEEMAGDKAWIMVGVKREVIGPDLGLCSKFKKGEKRAHLCFLILLSVAQWSFRAPLFGTSTFVTKEIGQPGSYS
jgi:hypothetical protein